MENRNATVVYTLMNKHTPVLDVEYDLNKHEAKKVLAMHNFSYAPFSFRHVANPPVIDAFNNWWRKRAIPASRENLNHFYSVMQNRNLLELLELNFGLSLSDQYWVKAKDNEITWNAVNFFTNDFSEDIGEILIGNQNTSPLSVDSPDISSDGMLPKKWKLVDGKRMLMKGGHHGLSQEPYNEVIATLLYDRLLNEGEYVKYTLYTDEKDRTYSLCENMLSTQEELVTAEDIRNTTRQYRNENKYNHFVRSLEEQELERSYIKEFLAKMIVCDFLIANYDRHFKNFGIIRNIESLQITGFAPLYDNGASFFANMELKNALPSPTAFFAKPFLKDQNTEKQLALIETLDWFDADALKGFDQVIDEQLSQSSLAVDPSKKRINGLMQGFQERVCIVKELQQERRQVQGMGMVFNPQEEQVPAMSPPKRRGR